MTVLRVRSIVMASVAIGVLSLPLMAAPPTQGTPRRTATPPFNAVPLPKTIPLQAQGSPPNRALPQFQLPPRTIPKITLPQMPPRTLPLPSTTTGRLGSPPARNVGAAPLGPGGLVGNGITINPIPAGLERRPGDLGDQVRDALAERERIGNLSDRFRPQDGNWGGPLPWDWGQADPGNPADPAPPADPAVEAGPTPWDWVAIGLSAAALLRAHQDHGGVVGYPIVCPSPAITVPADNPETPPGVTAQEMAPARSASVGEPRGVDEMPRLESGKSFELPGRGFGQDAGRVAVKIGPVFAECRVESWSDTVIRATIPPLVLEECAKAELIAAKHDGVPLAKLEFLLVPMSHVSPVVK